MEEAPRFRNIEGWINTDPMGLYDMTGKALLVEFWSLSSPTSMENISRIERLLENYREDGLEVIGVHTPEFDFEKERERVEIFLEREGVGYPVALDSDNETWEQYGNRHVPRQALVDPDGHIRHESAGVIDSPALENSIRKVLLERGGSPGERIFDTSEGTPLPEMRIHAGADTGDMIGNSHFYSPYSTVSFEEDDDRSMNFIYLHGEWMQDHEAVKHERNGRISLRFLGRGCGAVISGKPTRISVELKGGKVPGELRSEHLFEEDGETVLRTDSSGYFPIISGEEESVHDLRLVPGDEGVRFHTFEIFP